MSLIILLLLLVGCGHEGGHYNNSNQSSSPVQSANSELPAPDLAYHVDHSPEIVGFKSGETPLAPPGFNVTAFATKMNRPRWLKVLPNGDVLVAESEANRITLLRDRDGDGKADLRKTFLSGLNRPFGMVIAYPSIYVTTPEGLWVFPFNHGQTHISARGRKIHSFPSQNGHWTRSLLINPAHDRLYVGIGSASDHGEDGDNRDMGRALILELHRDGTQARVFASGLRNPVGMAWRDGKLWVVVAERDNLGEDTPPDYFTVVEDGDFYGWPYAYYGKNPDPRLNGRGAERVNESLTPKLSLGAHSTPLGLEFSTGHSFPKLFRKGAFIALHGSWNRNELAGYKVVYVNFFGDSPQRPVDFLTGFIIDQDHVRGRPVGLAVHKDGSLLVADDGSNTIWRVQYQRVN